MRESDMSNPIVHRIDINCSIRLNYIETFPNFAKFPKSIVYRLINTSWDMTGKKKTKFSQFCIALNHFLIGNDGFSTLFHNAQYCNFQERENTLYQLYRFKILLIIERLISQKCESIIIDIKKTIISYKINCVIRIAMAKSSLKTM